MTDLDRIEEVARAGESLDAPTTLALIAEVKRLSDHVEGLDAELCMALEALKKRGADQYISDNYPHWETGSASSFSNGCPTARKALGDTNA